MATAAATTKGLDWKVGSRGFAARLGLVGPGCACAAEIRAAVRSRAGSLSGGAGLTGGWAESGASRADCSAQQGQQFNRIESRRRCRQAGGAKDPKQLRRASDPVMRQDVKAGERRYHPGSVPVQRRHIVAGVKAEIQQPAADDQGQHRDEEDPVQNDIVGAEPGLLAAEQSAQANLVELDAAAEPGPCQIDDIGERHRDQHHGGLHVRHPHALARQHGVEQIDPAASRRFGRDAQSTDEGDAERGDHEPVQDDRAVVGFPLPHARAPS